MNFEEIIHPISKIEFFRDYIGKKPIIKKNGNKNFSSLIEYRDINRIIQEHRLEHPRMRMFKDITLVPETNYSIKNPSRRGSVNPIISVREFNHEIMNGATLIIDAIQEVHKPIRDLCDEFNHSLRGVCQVNAYIALADQQAFDTHWDGHEVFVLQIKGKKHWTIYHPTRIHPLDTDIYQADKSKEKKVFWEGVIEEGDFLYIPKGWWHTVSPVGDETVHLTFGYVAPTGIDFLKWATEQLYIEEFVRAPAPIFEDSTEYRKYTDKIRSLLTEHVNEIGFKKYVTDRIGKLHPRIAPALPYSADPRSRNLPSDLLVSPSSKNITISKNESTFHVMAFNKKYEFDIRFFELANNLLCGQNKISEAIEHSAHNEETTRGFIKNFMQLGLLQIL
jgi:ribosomal protein L16 Arg81 hydroxylase